MHNGKQQAVAPTGKQFGTVKWFNDAKGFGFITPDSKGPDVFVHHSAIDMGGFRTLEEGSPVEFFAIEGPKGIMASKVKSTR